MLLNDAQIEGCQFRDFDGNYPGQETDMIRPFVSKLVRENNGQKCISYGLSSTGYDIRLDRYFKKPVYTVIRDEHHDSILDPHNADNIGYKSFEDDSVVLFPGEMILGASIETFNMPPNVCGVCTGKSTYARLGVFANITPLECGWKGQLTIELSNIGHCPVVVYANEGIAQVLFFRVERPMVTYADRGGKYQNQVGVTTAKL